MHKGYRLGIVLGEWVVRCSANNMLAYLRNLLVEYEFMLIVSFKQGQLDADMHVLLINYLSTTL